MKYLLCLLMMFTIVACNPDEETPTVTYEYPSQELFDLYQKYDLALTGAVKFKEVCEKTNSEQFRDKCQPVVADLQHIDDVLTEKFHTLNEQHNYSEITFEDIKQAKIREGVNLLLSLTEKGESINE